MNALIEKDELTSSNRGKKHAAAYRNGPPCGDMHELPPEASSALETGYRDIP